MKYRVTRVIKTSECHWLANDIQPDEEFYRFNGCTYGCVSAAGVACSSDPSPDSKFFELPTDALEEID